MIKEYRIYVNDGGGSLPVMWAPIFDTLEEAQAWVNKDHGWEGRVDVEEFEYEECACKGCMEKVDYSSFYCQECFDQNCEEEENH
jgi:hypothetical protein